MQVSDDLYLGPAVGPTPTSKNALEPSPMSAGVGPAGRAMVYDIVPLALATNNLALAQAVAGAVALALTAGAGVTASLDPSGSQRYTLDVPRALQIVSTNAGDTTQTALVTGLDFYGQPMSQRLTLNGTTPRLGTKAFSVIQSIVMSAATAGNVSVGTTNIFGLPVCVIDAGYLDPSWANALARDAGTFVAAVTTAASPTTGDVRGTYAPSSVADGVKRLVVDISLSDANAGAGATRAGAYGVTQA